jgi:6-phosphofructokinase 1
MIFQNEFNFPVIGIPGTIDNDLFGTSHTLGYDTALNTVMEAIDKIRDTAISHDRLFFVEVMGRDAGHIALNSGIAIGAQEILIPEENIGMEELIISLKKSKEAGKTSSIVVVAEGDKTGKNVFELAKRVEDKFPDYEIKVSVLGHMQRGGSPTCFDRVLATRMGVKAVESLLAGEYSKMVGVQHGEITLTPLDLAIKGKSKINSELLRVSEIMNT